MWYIYILECRDGSYYTGVAKDVRARLDKHNSGKGAKYTRMKRPCTIIYVEEHPDESSARRREMEIKGWRRDKKEGLIRGFPSSALDDLLRISGQ
jgi:predicted GIY-YIG superfamily endonuclease